VNLVHDLLHREVDFLLSRSQSLASRDRSWISFERRAAHTHTACNPHSVDAPKRVADDLQHARASEASERLCIAVLVALLRDVKRVAHA
jgi:hypothetical protein